MKTIMAAIVGISGLSAMSAVVFKEDFAQRSVDPSMSRRMANHWSSCEYVSGSGTVNPLAYSYIYGTYRYSPELPYSDVSQIQDGWIMGGTSSRSWVPGFFTTTNSSDELPGDTDRPFAALSIGGGATYYESRVMQPIGNSFSNGTVRYTIDFRAPGRWYREGYGVAPMIRFYPATRQMLACPDLTTGPTPHEAPCGFGMNGASEGPAAFISDVYAFLLCGSGDPTPAIQGRTFGNAAPLHWYRFAVDVDLDGNKCSGIVRDLGDRVPDWNTAGTQIGSWEDAPFYRALTGETGPIEGICIYNGGISSDGNSVVTNMGCFKNISVAWKAPGMMNFKPCYSNDFVVRRSCVISQPNGELFSHAASGESWTTNTLSSYESFGYNDDDANTRHIVNINTAAGSGIAGTDRFPVGLDGWRRLNAASQANATVVAGGGASGNLLRFNAPSSGNPFIVCGQTLGETITSGKVRLSVVGRTPDAWFWDVLSAVYVALGDANLYDATYAADITMRYNGVLGFLGTINPYSCIPCVNVLDRMDTGVSGAAIASDCWARWFKFTMTADLDARTLDCEIVRLADNNILATTGDTVFSQTGVPFLNDLSDVGSFALMGYGIGVGWISGVIFDAIEVWKDVGTANEKRIYYNDFDRRERVIATSQSDDNLADAAGLAATDGWWMRSGSFKVHALDENAFVSAEAARGAAGVAVRPCGAVMKNESITISADIRPPAKWQWLGARDASVAFGGDSFLRGQYDGTDFLSAAAMRFGFDSGNDATGAYGTSQSRTVELYATGGGGRTVSPLLVDVTHWYRFAATANMSDRTWKLAVYDMGTAQPEANAAVGAPVTVLEGLSLGGTDAELTAFAISAAGLEGDAPWFGGGDPGFALVDNVTLDRNPFGMKLIFR